MFAPQIILPPDLDDPSTQIAPHKDNVIPLPVRRRDASAAADEPRPTLRRPTAPSARLFQGWGPRLL